MNIEMSDGPMRRCLKRRHPDITSFQKERQRTLHSFFMRVPLSKRYILSADQLPIFSHFTFYILYEYYCMEETAENLPYYV